MDTTASRVAVLVAQGYTTEEAMLIVHVVDVAEKQRLALSGSRPHAQPKARRAA